MKERLKKIFIPIFLSVLCGLLCGRLLFSIYDEKKDNVLLSNVIYLLEDASYDDYDSMKVSGISNFIYYKDNGKYNKVVALTKNKNNIDKIEKVYDKELNVKEYLINDMDIINQIDEYDNDLTKAKSNEEIKEIVINMINLYKDRDDIKMVKIS